MNRRKFVSSAALATFGQIARAQLMYPPPPPPQTAQIAFPEVMLAAEIQECPEWCWAASLSAVFRFFGKTVDQKTIVMRKYGQLACAPSQTAAQIAAFLNTQWIDEVTRQPFTAHLTAAFDAVAGVGAINNSIIVNELVNQRPVVYCNLSHCMVIVGVTYLPTTPFPSIQNVRVMDPWPLSPRLHPLSAPEMFPARFGPLGYMGGGQMSFLGTVLVS